MPINLFNSPLSSIKLGDDDILKGYIGNGQIFPNNTEIKGAAFTNSNIVNTGGNTSYVVAGDVGASFTLTGSNGATAPSGTQVLSASSATYQIAIGDQSNTCGAATRNAQIVVAPQGDTVLSSTATYNITVSNASGSNKYYVDGVLQPDLPLTEGNSYTINQDDASNASHPLILSTSAIASGVYSTGVTYTLDGSTVSYSGYISGFAAASQRRLTVNLSSSSPSLNYICYYHQNMGNSIITSDSNNTDTIIQAAGPAYNPVTTSLTLSASVYDNVVVTQNGTKYWGNGAKVRFNITVSTNSTLHAITLQGISPSQGNKMAINTGFGGSTTGPGNGYVWDDYLPDSTSGYNGPIFPSNAPYAVWNSTPATNGLPSGISMIFYNSGQGLLTNMGATLTLTGNTANCDQLSNTTITTRLYPV